MASSGRIDYADAEYWDRLVQASPAAATAHATALIESGRLGTDERALAHTAIARALFETGSVTDALDAARRGLEDSAGSPASVRNPVGMTASVILAEAGYVTEAIESLESLAARADGVQLGRFRMQISYVLHHAGRLNDALAELESAETLLSQGEERDRFRVFHHRGLVLLQQGRLREADADFEVAESIAASIGLKVAQGQSAANRAVLSGRARRLAESLRHFDRAAALFAEAGDPVRPVALMEIDRAEVLMHSGLPLDAVVAARHALDRVEPTGNRMLSGDALLILARAELAAGRSRRAIESAVRAEAAFADSGRHDMVTHAAVVRARAGLRAAETAEAARSAIASSVEIGGRLAAEGWMSTADDLALERVRTAWRCAVLDAVPRELERLRAGAGDGQRHTELAGWFCEALRRWVDGASDAAMEACLAALDQLDEIVDEATSLEQRSAAMMLGHDVSQLTIDLAVERSDADTVLAAAEGTRARALHHEIADTERHRPLTEAGAERLRRELVARLGSRVLVEWVVSGGVVWAVVLDGNGSRLVRIASRDEVVRARDRLMAWLDVAAAEPDASSRRAERAAAVLDELLLAPLGLADDAAVVVVPVDALHAVPWSGLPRLAHRACTLVPNAQVWLEADRRAAGRVASIGLVAGPDVASVDVEREAVARHGTVAVSAGVGAGAASVRAMFASSDLLHVAAHGTFRSDRPLLSTIRLHDGEAALHDVLPERIGAQLVVLSSCEAGAQGVADGSEVLGFSAVLLARGAAAVLAPLSVVRDLECAEFVADVHDELRSGTSVADAVATVRSGWLGHDDLSRWAVASSFTCFGSGAVAVGR